MRVFIYQPYIVALLLMLEHLPLSHGWNLASSPRSRSVRLLPELRGRATLQASRTMPLLSSSAKHETINRKAFNGNNGDDAIQPENARGLGRLSKVTLTLGVAAACAFVVRNPRAFMAYKAWSIYLQSFISQTLAKFESAGLVGLIMYTMFMWIWEITFGITTPVETAAGMAFGQSKAFVASALGKFLGAITSFLVGRYILTAFVSSKVAENEILNLVRAEIEENPLKVAILTRFSPLPEFAKNCGLAALPVNFGHFALAVLIHGLPFSFLWVSMGAEAAQVIKGGKPSTALKVITAFVPWLGVIVPALIGIWLRRLRRKWTDVQDSPINT